MFYHYKDINKQTVREASHSTAKDVLQVWEQARIPTRLKKHAVEKIEGLFKDYDKLMKNKENKAKRSEALKMKEEEWKTSLDDLFDIAHAQAMEQINIQEDRQFLTAQCEVGRPGMMAGVDKTLARREGATVKRQQDFRRRVEKKQEQMVRKSTLF